MLTPAGLIDTSPLGFVDLERRRLLGEPAAFERAVGGLYPYIIDCAEPAELVLARARELMSIVVDVTLTGRWPALEEWRTILPAWFLSACAPVPLPTDPPVTPPARMSARRRKAYYDTLKWDLEYWLFSMVAVEMPPNEPVINRYWYRWDAEIVGPHTINAAVDLVELSTGGFDWLFRAAGARTVDEPDVA